MGMCNPIAYDGGGGKSALVLQLENLQIDTLFYLQPHYCGKSRYHFHTEDEI